MDEQKARSWGNRIILGLRMAFYELQTVMKRRSRLGMDEPTQQAKAEAGLFVIREMVKIAGELKASLVLLHIGRLDGVDPATVSDGWMPLPAAFLSGLPEEVIFIDATHAVKDFFARNPGGKLTLPKDDHPNAKAHEIFAEILKEKITTVRSSK